MSARYREGEFTLTSRKMSSGITVWYYYMYDSSGRRKKFSTGIGYKSTRDKVRSRREAEAFVEELALRGSMDQSERDITLSDFLESRNFWNWHTSDYVRSKLARSDEGKPGITESYVITAEQITRDHILPYHGEKKLKEISSRDLESLLFRWIESGASHKSAMNWRSIYSVILGEAARLDYIPLNPWAKVPGLTVKARSYGALTIAETSRIISPDGIDFDSLPERIYFLASRLAFLTGLRIGEVCGLHTDDIRDEYIERDGERIRLSYLNIKMQWNSKTGSRQLVKDKDERNVPIAAALRDDIAGLVGECSGFVFSFASDHSSPITANRLREWLYKRMKAVGISDEDRATRNITFHSTRRFFNTLLRSSGVNDSIIRRFTGHDSERMTDHYTDYLPEDLGEISRAQSRLIEG